MFEKKPYQPVMEIFTKNVRYLSDIVIKVNTHKAIEKMLKEMCDIMLGIDFSVANFRQGCLVLQFNNAAAASQVRYQIPTLISRLYKQPGMSDLITIKCLVRPEPRQPAAEKTFLHLSQKNAELIRDTANYIKDDNLSNALLKLSRHGISEYSEYIE